MKKNTKIVIIISILLIVTIITSFLVFFNKDKKVTNTTGAMIDMLSYNSAGPRKKYNFNYDWKFAFGSGTYNSGSDYTRYCIIDQNNQETSCIDSTTDPGAPYVESMSKTVIDSEIESPFDNAYQIDNRWENVSLPHTYNDIDTFNNFIETGGNTLHGERSMYTGTAWYKKEFFVPDNYQGKRFFIEFEAARQAAKVYLNGTLIEGTYENGFIPFGYDLTEYINYGENNYITVFVDNSFPYTTESSGKTSEVPWHDSHWHPNYGGLYRNCYLYIMEDLHFTLPLYSFTEGSGTYVYTTDEDGNASSATVHVDSEIENSSLVSKTFVVKATIYNHENEFVTDITSNSITLASGQKTVVELSKLLNNVKRWSTEYPYLYSVECEILIGDEIVDNNKNTFGVRTYRFTRDYGFYLNENYTALDGWGQKSTMEWAGLGAAYPNWMTDKVIKLMKDANGNYIRFGHTSGSPAQIEAADKYGIIVTQPGVDGEGDSAVNYDGYGYDQNTLLLRAEAYRDMLLYYRNHPSILLWEIGNYSTPMGVSIPKERINTIGLMENYNVNANLARLLYDMTALIDYGNREFTSLGSARNTGYYNGTSPTSDRLLTMRSAASSQFNYIEVTEGTNGVESTYLSGKPFLESEYNRDETPRRIWDSATNTYTPTGRPKEYYRSSKDAVVSAITQRENIYSVTRNIGGSNWIFSDSISHGRLTSEVARTTGEVDATMIPKETYYAFQTISSKNVGSYIVGHWNYASGSNQTVYVVAKGIYRMKLFVNDVEYNTGEKSNSYLWTFSNIPYATGTITAKGYDADGNEIAGSISMKTSHGLPSGIRLSLVNETDLLANGSDIALIDAEIIDSNNNRCVTHNTPTLTDKINFSITGDTTKFIWRGGYNSGIAYSTNSYSLYPESGIIRVAIRTTMQNGTINLSANTDSGLVSNSLSITSVGISNNDGLLTGVNTSSYSTNYDISTLPYLKYGYGVRLGKEFNERVVDSSILIDELAHNSDSDMTIEDSLAQGRKMYFNSDITFINVPYKYLNSEFIHGNVDDSANINFSMTFTPKKNIDIFVLRDPRITTNPSWLSAYTLTSDTIIGGNGVVYDIYKKSIVCSAGVCPLVAIGPNVDNINDLNDGVNQIVVFKETEKLSIPYEFFSEDISFYDENSLINGWNYGTYPGTSLVSATIDNTTFASDSNHQEVIYFEDDSIATDTFEGNLAMIEKEFAPLTSDFEVEFDAYITDLATNTWLRVYLSGAPITSHDDKTSVGIEAYIARDGSTIKFSARNTNNDVMVDLLTGLNINAWNHFVMKVETSSHKVSVKANDGEFGTEVPYASAINSFATIIFGSGVSTTSDFYLDNIKINPIITSPLASVTVDDIVLDSFAEDHFDYYVLDVTSTSNISVETNIFCSEYSVSYDTDHFVISLVDVNGNNWNYYIYDAHEAPLLQDWNIVSTPGTTVQVLPIDGEDAIVFVDNESGSNAWAYIERPISPLSNIFEISYKLYMPASTHNNKYYRAFLANEPWSTQASYQVGLKTHFDKLNATSMQFYYYCFDFNESNVLVETKHIYDTSFNLGAWHEVKYVVNQFNHTYDVYIDNMITPIITNAKFLNDITPAYLQIGTGGNATNEFYVKDYEFKNHFENPVTGLSYDNIPIVDFDPVVTEYELYSNHPVSNDIEASIAYSNSADSSSIVITKDIIEQTVTYEISDLNGETYTYVLNVYNGLLRPITIAELQTLVDSVIDLEAINYSQSSWARFAPALASAQTILSQQNPVEGDIINAYNELELSITLLVQMTPINFESAFMRIVYVSGDLINWFEGANAKPVTFVLENDIPVYKDNDTITFRSVPKKYQNADFLNIPATGSFSTSEINFLAKRDVSLMVFRDQKAGPVTEDGFEFTGDIVTAYDSVNNIDIVYKVYKKNYVSGTRIVVDLKSLANNTYTSNGNTMYHNVIAFKDEDDVTNNYFLNDITSKYGSKSNFFNAWGVYSYDSTGSTTNNEQNYVSDELSDFYGSIEMISNAGSSSVRSWSEAFRRYAKQYGKYNVQFSLFADSSSSYNNEYIRLWITNDSPINWEVGSTDVKTNVQVETYLGLPKGSTTYAFVRRGFDKDGAYSSDNIRIVSVNKGTWISPVKYEIDTKNKSYYTNVNNNALLGPYPFVGNNFAFTDHILFGTRATNNTHYWFKDLVIEPIEEDLLSSIYLDGGTRSIPLGDSLILKNNYTSSTKDYMYQSNDLDNIEILVDPGENINIINQNPLTYNYEITDEINYTQILATGDEMADGSALTLDHRVYYETSCETQRGSLRDLIDYAFSLNQSSYLAYGWSDFQTQISNSLTTLANNLETCQNISTQTEALQDAIDALIPVSGNNIFYTGNIYYGNDLALTPTEEVHITNNSSFTFEATMNSLVGAVYPYENVDHLRTVESSTVLPAGTKITFIDSSSSNPSFYYYIVTPLDVTNLKTSYDLSEFKKMGVAGEYYSNDIHYYDSTTQRISSRFIFIVDFENVATPLANGAYTIKLINNVASIIFNMNDLIYNIYDSEGTNSFAISSNQESYALNESVDLSFSSSHVPSIVSQKEIIDTSIANQKVGVVFTLYQNSQRINLPDNTKITFNNNICYVLNNECRLLLGEDNITGTINIDFGVNNPLETGLYTLKADLIKSDDGRYGNIIDTKNITFELTQNADYGFKVILNSANYNIFYAGQNNIIEYNFTVVNASNNYNIVVSLKKKEGNDYTLIDLNPLTNASLHEFSQYKYSLGKINTWEAIFNEDVGVGSYQLCFDLYDNGQYITTINTYFVAK